MEDVVDVSRSGLVVGVCTALSRTLGFTRWIVLSVTVGATFLGNTYQTANTVPNVLFELAAGGILSAVLLPAFVTALERGRERLDQVASCLLNLFLCASLPLVLAGILLARPVMRGLTAGVAEPAIRDAEVELGAWFLRFFAPQIPLYVLAMGFTAVLHTHRRFVMPALAPAASSAVVIATYLAYRAAGRGTEIGSVSPRQLRLLALGTTAGVAVLCFSQLPAVLRTGFRWRPVLRPRDPEVIAALRAGVWGAGYFAVTQAGLLAALVLANRVRGGVVAWQVALAFVELPNALAGLALAVASFPSLAQAFARRDDDTFARLLSATWRNVCFLAAPAAAGLVALAVPLTRALLRSRASAATPDVVSAALGALAWGLPAYALHATLVRPLYARRETRPPVALNAIGVAVFVTGAALVATRARGTGSLAAMGAAHAAGQWCALAAGVVLLARRVRTWRAGSDVSFLAVSLARAVLVGIAAHAASRGLHSVAAGVAAGLVVYALLAGRSEPARRLLSSVRRGP